MADVSIVGAAGYTGQETLDRVLGHPQLNLVAVGSDSLAGQSGSALDPRLAHAAMPVFVTNEAALAHEADVTIICLSHEAAAAIDVPHDGVVVDLSGAHRLRDAASYETWYGFAHPRPDELGDWTYGLPELVAEAGRLIANPGCYATATLLALAPLRHAIEPGSVVVDGLSGMTGAGRTLKASSARGLGARERLALPRRGAPARTRDRAAARVRRHLRAAPPARPSRPDRDLLRPLHRAGPAGAARGGLCRQRRRHGSSGGGGSRARPRPAHRPGRDRRLQRPLHGRTIVICAIDNLGKGAAGQAVQNVNRALRLEDTAGLRLAGVLV